MSAVDPHLLRRARRWQAEDPDQQSAAELGALIAAATAGDASAAAELADAFAGLLQFGTAGVRGRLGPGPNRMNRAVVSRVAAGLAAHIGVGRVVIGFDGRHHSDAFARQAARVLAGAGLEVLLLPRPLPTPVLAFAVLDRHCCAGVMVTASHNPAQDNGMKVYLADGRQIIPPHDAEIAEAMATVGVVPLSEEYAVLDEAVVDAYIAGAAAVAGPGTREIRLVSTAMHGVGHATLERVLTVAGFHPPIPVAEQRDPNPDFPSVDFPNPEEPGAVDLALATAHAHDADAVIALDPDADRCAVAVRDAHGLRLLTGDELGCLLGWWIIERDRRAGRRTTGAFATTIVSSRLLARIAADAGLEHAETLTGFKWIARVPRLRFGYEEAIGYCVAPWLVRDKDGITAAVLAAELLASLRAEHRTARQVLDGMARRYGLHATRAWSLRVAETAQLQAAMDRVRTRPPTALGGSPVSSVTDFATEGSGLPTTDAIRFLTADDSRVVVRPSGTEPKLKAYVEVIAEAGGDLAQARAEAEDRLTRLASDITDTIAAR